MHTGFDTYGAIFLTVFFFIGIVSTVLAVAYLLLIYLEFRDQQKRIAEAMQYINVARADATPSLNWRQCNYCHLMNYYVPKQKCINPSCPSHLSSYRICGDDSFNGIGIDVQEITTIDDEPSNDPRNRQGARA